MDVQPRRFIRLFITLMLTGLILASCDVRPAPAPPQPTYTPWVVIITATPAATTEPAPATPTTEPVVPTPPAPGPTATPPGPKPTPPPIPTPQPKPPQRPRVSITAPPPNAQFNVNQAITVKFNAQSTEGLSVAELYVGQNRVGYREYPQRPASLADSLAWTPGQEGTYVFSIIVYDDQYTPSNAAKVTVKVVQQVTIPQVRIDYPPGRIVIRQNQDLDIRATATDATRVQRVELWVDGLFQAAQDNPPQQFTFRWRTDRVGEHDAWVRAISASGGMADSNHVTIGVADDNPPSVEVRLDQTTVNVGTPVNVRTRAYDSKGITRIALLVNGGAVDTWTAPDPTIGQSSANITQRWTPTAPGTYNINVQAWDSVGKTTVSPTQVVVVNQPTPSPVGIWAGQTVPTNDTVRVTITRVTGKNLEGTLEVTPPGSPETLAGPLQNSTVEGNRVRLEASLGMIMVIWHLDVTMDAEGRSMTGTWYDSAGNQGTITLIRREF